jgi:DNA-binding protein YbaB
MLSEQMQALADEAVKKYRKAVVRELQAIDDASDAKLEGRGEFSIHNLEISEGHLLQEGKEILDELIASAGYKAVEGKLLKKNGRTVKGGEKK